MTALSRNALTTIRETVKGARAALRGASLGIWTAPGFDLESTTELYALQSRLFHHLAEVSTSLSAICLLLGEQEAKFVSPRSEGP